MKARFFLENKEVIGLWMIYAIVMWLVICLLDLIFDFIKTKIKKNKQIKQRRIQHKRKVIEEVEQIKFENWLYEFNKSFDQIVKLEI